MILMISILIIILLISLVYIIHGIYISDLEFKLGIKGFNLKIETKEKKRPSRKD